jgi:YfiH family protein
VAEYSLSRLIVLDQIHSDVGICADDILPANKYSFLDFQGDFLTTSKKNIGLAVLTADCVPLVLYDQRQRVVSVIHAGWKGAFAGVVEQALTMMRSKYQTSVQDIKAFFGPAARACCYQVTKDFQNQFEKKFEIKDAFFYHSNSIYFDNSLFLQQNLKKFGILESNINFENALCTICNTEFCSFRREKQLAHRQITIVVLR